MQTFPLVPLTIDQAMRLQFKLVDKITAHFGGAEFLSCGDVGLVSGFNKPSYTAKVEAVLADFFDCEACVLVRGAGTAAIRWGLWSLVKPNGSILLHDAPIYPTTKTIVESMALKTIVSDYNSESTLIKTLGAVSADCALIQYSRQKIDDHYTIADVIAIIAGKNIPIITDDNYVVMKTDKIGVQCGADLSAFSLFKLLGPEGIGCVLGKRCYIERITKANYSGGGQVQGHEAMDALRSLVYTPVALAIQAEVGTEVIRRLNAGEVRGVKRAFIANAQSRVIIVELSEPNAPSVIENAEKLGAAPHPVGAESRYEITPMFYRVSGTFRASIPDADSRLIRINPMRSGADTVLRILAQAIQIDI
ncbi:MAG: aminotransferase class V-fold PLP-dependent enzyme [Negativicutes bacterium]|jgi:hypothetical protein